MYFCTPQFPFSFLLGFHRVVVFQCMYEEKYWWNGLENDGTVVHTAPILREITFLFCFLFFFYWYSVYHWIPGEAWRSWLRLPLMFLRLASLANWGLSRWYVIASFCRFLLVFFQHFIMNIFKQRSWNYFTLNICILPLIFYCTLLYIYPFPYPPIILFCVCEYISG